MTTVASFAARIPASVVMDGSLVAAPGNADESGAIQTMNTSRCATTGNVGIGERKEVKWQIYAETAGSGVRCALNQLDAVLWRRSAYLHPVHTKENSFEKHNHAEIGAAIILALSTPRLITESMCVPPTKQKTRAVRGNDR